MSQNIANVARHGFLRPAPKGFMRSDRPWGYLDTVLQAGVSPVMCQLKRVTLKFCKSDDKGRHMRQFCEKHLAKFAQENTSVAIYVVPEEGQNPSVRVEYLNGTDEVHKLNRMEHDDILVKMNKFAMHSGQEIIALYKPFRTHCPSIQGQWNQFLTKKDYDITKPLDWSTKRYNTWETVKIPYKSRYRATENVEIPELSLEEKVGRPLGPFGPTLKKQY